MYTKKSQLWMAALSVLARMAVAVIVVVCATHCYPECTVSNAEGFDYQETSKTTGGISIDERGEEVDLEAMDRAVDAAEKCLIDVVPGLADWQRRHAGCDKDTFNSFTGIDRAGLRVRIDEDWRWSEDGLWQLTSAKAPASSCQAKGMSEHADECRWRAAVQDCDTIIVGPLLHNIADPLVKIALGCEWPWALPQLAACMSAASQE
jgi:hypothetical protein